MEGNIIIIVSNNPRRSMEYWLENRLVMPLTEFKINWSNLKVEVKGLASYLFIMPDIEKIIGRTFSSIIIDDMYKIDAGFIEEATTRMELLALRKQAKTSTTQL